ncbi:hypothetical protein HanOQP8_Chr16g0630971 [Helianthus annuus]|nr:hypothetical protein HanHA89_Chr16g0676221 [Helianthus annuus]KAJ0646058.1 hypothetical protein HanOQP8_Chr16g0630971 [Helianthus annuus]KAJ0822695.1 hypothetical protein HanPSC8_Chr16g0735121 [Helianthus annuus]
MTTRQTLMEVWRSTIFTLLSGSRLQEGTSMLLINSTILLVKESTAMIHVAPNQHLENYIIKAVNERTASVVLVGS